MNQDEREAEMKPEGTVNSEERDDRLRRIQERVRQSPHAYTADFHFLLSLLDSQAVEPYPPVTNTGRGRCRHNVPTCGECQIGEVLAHVKDKEQVANDAATRMRDQCVEKVRGMKRSTTGITYDYGGTAHDAQVEAIQRRNILLEEVVIEIESLTLDSAEQREEKES